MQHGSHGTRPPVVVFDMEPPAEDTEQRKQYAFSYLHVVDLPLVEVLMVRLFAIFDDNKSFRVWVSRKIISFNSGAALSFSSFDKSHNLVIILLVI